MLDFLLQTGQWANFGACSNSEPNWVWPAEQSISPIRFYDLFLIPLNVIIERSKGALQLQPNLEICFIRLPRNWLQAVLTIHSFAYQELDFNIWKLTQRIAREANTVPVSNTTTGTIICIPKQYTKTSGNHTVIVTTFMLAQSDPIKWWTQYFSMTSSIRVTFILVRRLGQSRRDKSRNLPFKEGP